MNLDKNHNPYIGKDGIDDPPRGLATAYSVEQSDTAFVVNEFIRWLREQQSIHSPTRTTRPGWFAHVSLLRPHPPFCAPEPFNQRVAADAVPKPIGHARSDQTAALHPWLAYTMEQLPKSHFIAGAEGLVRDWDEHDLRAIRAIYFGMIGEVDHHLGRLFAALEEHQCWENTLIVFTSDHGEQLGDHRLLGKHGFFDSSYHIPLIIRDPTQPAGFGASVNQFSEAIDVVPTLLELFAGNSRNVLDGRSLAGALTGEPIPNWRDMVYWEYDFRDPIRQHPERALGLESRRCNLSVLRSEGYKFVHFSGLAPLLFDLERDPQEMQNVIDKPEYQSVRIACAEQLLSWRAEHLEQTLALSAVSANGLVRVSSDVVRGV